MNLATLTDVGRADIVTILMQRPLHLAWGRGDPAWGSSSDPEKSYLVGTLRGEDALVDEVGRRRVDRVAYAVQDDAGEVVIPTGINPNGEVSSLRYRLSDEPTPNLYVRVAFDFAEAATETIRELGLFVGTVAADGLPAGQMYLLPAQVADPGKLYLVQRLDPFILRAPGQRQDFELVMPI